MVIADKMSMKSEMESFLHWLATYLVESGQMGLPALLLQQGMWFEARANSDEYPVAKKWKKKSIPKAQDCYYNAQEFCRKSTEVAISRDLFWSRRGCVKRPSIVGLSCRMVEW